jgi:hypothetical protein
MSIMDNDKCNPIHDTYVERKACHEAYDQTIPDIIGMPECKKKGDKGHPDHYPRTVFGKGKEEEDSRSNTQK